jgi:hypothetical protein
VSNDMTHGMTNTVTALVTTTTTLLRISPSSGKALLAFSFMARCPRCGISRCVACYVCLLIDRVVPPDQEVAGLSLAEWGSEFWLLLVRLAEDA